MSSCGRRQKSNDRRMMQKSSFMRAWMLHPKEENFKV
jgi:hypothetical protein